MCAGDDERRGGRRAAGRRRRVPDGALLSSHAAAPTDADGRDRPRCTSELRFSLHVLTHILRKMARVPSTVALRDRPPVTVSVGNPHLVVFVRDNSEAHTDALADLARAAQADAHLFPDSVNVSFVVPLSGDRAAVRTFERGCGWTLACGSGCCASAFALAGASADQSFDVTTELPLGSLRVHFDGEQLVMSGPAQAVFVGRLSGELMKVVIEFV